MDPPPESNELHHRCLMPLATRVASRDIRHLASPGSLPLAAISSYERPQHPEVPIGRGVESEVVERRGDVSHLEYAFPREWAATQLPWRMAGVAGINSINTPQLACHENQETVRLGLPDQPAGELTKPPSSKAGRVETGAVM